MRWRKFVEVVTAISQTAEETMATAMVTFNKAVDSLLKKTTERAKECHVACASDEQRGDFRAAVLCLS